MLCMYHKLFSSKPIILMNFYPSNLFSNNISINSQIPSKIINSFLNFWTNILSWIMINLCSIFKNLSTFFVYWTKDNYRAWNFLKWMEYKWNNYHNYSQNQFKLTNIYKFVENLFQNLQKKTNRKESKISKSIFAYDD